MIIIVIIIIIIIITIIIIIIIIILWPYELTIFDQPKVCPGKWAAQTPLGFWDTNGSPND